MKKKICLIVFLLLAVFGFIASSSKPVNADYCDENYKGPNPPINSCEE